MFKLTIETENATFGEYKHEEVARILHEAARRVAHGEHYVPLLDANGNRVGVAEFTEIWDVQI